MQWSIFGDEDTSIDSNAGGGCEAEKTVSKKRRDLHIFWRWGMFVEQWRLSTRVHLYADNAGVIINPKGEMKGESCH